jgi:hypothetical protein
MQQNQNDRIFDMNLPADPQRFWSTGAPQAELGEPPDPPGLEQGSVLEQIGPSPFPKSKFPFLGLLETIYEHVSEHAASRRAGERHNPAGPER